MPPKGFDRTVTQETHMKSKLPPARFRRQLKEQLGILETEGVLSPPQVQQLTDRYQLGNLAAETTQSLLMTIYMIGSVLIGIGIISFVAAHWEELSRGTKVAMLFAAMLAAHTGGFVLWRWSGYPRLGHALVVLGTLIFGANIGLIAQIFQIQENPYNGFLLWSIGAAAVAYALVSVPNAMIALVTAGIFMFGNLTDFQGRGGIANQVFWPYIVLIVFVPMVYQLRSYGVVWLTSALWVLAMIGCMAGHFENHNAGFFVFLAISLASLGLLGWGVMRQRSEAADTIRVPACTLGILAATLATYLYSFHGISEDLITIDYSGWLAIGPMKMTLSAIPAVLAVGVAALALVRGIKAIPLLLIAVAVAIGIMAGIRVPGESYFELTIAANALYVLMVCVLFAASLAYEDRRIFWGSVFLAILLVVSRTLEYETELLIKAVIFIACGVALIVGGALFERYLKSRRVSHV
jgi:uncharacterized membrane protein